MALEMVYTSAARGLREGTSGFCTVAITRGLPLTMVPRLEAIGGYRAGPSGDGPVALSFYRLETAQGVVSVLARVAPAAPDHTNRSNKLATYLVLSSDEQSEAGPAWLLRNVSMRDSWSGAARVIEEPVLVPQGPTLNPAVCTQWHSACGDAGWAGVLASSFLRDMSRPAHVIYSAGADPLALVEEAARLLPPWARWRATFSTYFLQPVAGAPCCWRFCLDGTPAADAARGAKALVIDLTRPLEAAPDSRHVRAARTGVLEPGPGDDDRPKPVGMQPGWYGATRGGAGAADGCERDGRGDGGAGGGGEIDLEPMEPGAPGGSGGPGAAHDGAGGSRGTGGRVPTWASRMAGRVAGATARRSAGEEPSRPARPPRISATLLGVLAAIATVVGVIVIVVAFASEPKRSQSADVGQPPRASLDDRPTWRVESVGVGSPSLTADRKPIRSAADGDPVPPHSGREVPKAPPAPGDESVAQAAAPAPAGAAPAAASSITSTAPATSAAPVTPANPAAPASPAAPANPAAPADSSVAPAPAPADVVVPLIALRFVGSPGSMVAGAALPPGLNVASAHFVPPPALQQLGVVRDESSLRFPNSGGHATLVMKRGEIFVEVPSITNGIEAAAQAFFLAPNARPSEIARLVLRRVPIELLDSEGVLVARARVEPAAVLVPPELGSRLMVAIKEREPTLRIETYRETASGRTLIDKADLAAESSTSIKGLSGPIAIRYETKDMLMVTPEPVVDTVGVERAQRTVQIKLWDERIAAARTVRRRLEGKGVSQTALASALATIRASLTEEELKIVRGPSPGARTIEDTAALEALIPQYVERCERELKAAQEAMRAIPQGATPFDTVIAIDISTTDGLLLYSIYPMGRVR